MATRINVLIAEDSEDDTLLLIHELRRGGFEPDYERVETAQTMRRALQSRDWDLVISDHKMPQFSSTEALAEVKRSARDVPVIIVSGNIGEQFAVDAMRAGAHDYIMKDNLKRLAPAIERELREAKTVPPTVEPRTRYATWRTTTRSPIWSTVTSSRCAWTRRWPQCAGAV